MIFARGSARAAREFHSRLNLLALAIALPALWLGGCRTPEPPSTPEAFMKQAGEFYAQRKLEAAAEILRRGVAAFPEDAQLHFMLGNAYFRQQRWSNSTVHYAEAAALRPDHSDTFLCLGFALYQESRWADAIEAWRIAAWYSPEDALPRLSLAVGLLKLGLVHEAEGQISQAVTDPSWRSRLAIDIRFTPGMIQALELAAHGFESRQRKPAADGIPDQ